MRPSFLLHVEESYILSPIAGGARFLHRYRCGGLLASLRLTTTRRNFETMLASIHGILLGYLKSKYDKRPTSPRRPKPKLRTGLR